MKDRTVATIDLQALQHNWRETRQRVGNHHIMAMIKANGYGHGIIPVGKTLKQADAFGVATLEEALKLRSHGIQQEIVVMCGFYNEAELEEFSHHQLTAVVHHREQVDLLAASLINHPIKIWLKIDTGMHRLGFDLNEVDSHVEFLHQLGQVQKPIGLMSHLADADGADLSFTRRQIEKFKKITASKPDCAKSIGHSPVILACPEELTDWARPGIMLYGVSPFSNQTGEKFGLKPVMTLRSRLVAIKQVNQGEPIGYGCTWHCPQTMQIGVVGVGYGDGYPRHAPSGTPTLIHQKKCPVVGRVSMDMITVDLRQCPQATVGDEVVLWGENLPVETIASLSDTIGYELLCQVTNRVHFKFLE